MERYSEYKDSGEQWLGDIPSHWEMRKAKYLWEETDARSESGSEQLLSVSQYDGVKPSEEESRSESLDGYKIVKKDELVINIMLAWLGGLGVSSYEGLVSPAYCVYKLFDKQNPKYLHYLYKTPTYLAEFARRSTGIVPSRWRMYTDDFGQVLTLLPPLSEQSAIVAYLDRVTSQLDEAIAQQQRMIDLLNERKQIIIQHAVTKGLNPKAEMVESGSNFIGEIPVSWKVCKTLYVLVRQITDGPHTTPTLYSEGIPFVSAEAVSCGNGHIDFSHIRGFISESFYKECCKKYIPRVDDIYMIKSGATTGKVAIVDTNEKFTIWSPLAVFRANTLIMLPHFLYFALQSRYYQLQVQDKWSFGTQQNIGMRALEKLLLCYPPIEEQKIIIKYIEERICKIDSAISKCQHRITLLRERKQIIINEVVTGKVKVS